VGHLYFREDIRIAQTSLTSHAKHSQLGVMEVFQSSPSGGIEHLELIEYFLRLNLDISQSVVDVIWQRPVMITRLLLGARDPMSLFPPVRTLLSVIYNLFCFPSELGELGTHGDKYCIVVANLINKLLVIGLVHHYALEILNIISLNLLQLDMSI